MGNIIPKLNLNKTPSLVEPNSLVFAKNIRLDVDGSIHRDYGTLPMSIAKGVVSGDLVNYGSLVDRIYHEIDEEHSENTGDQYSFVLSNLKHISSAKYVVNKNFYTKNGKYKIVGYIADNKEFYLFFYGTYTPVQVSWAGSASSETELPEQSASCIIRYSEDDNRFHPCNCNWNYSNGAIDGCVINNLRGEKILVITETNGNSLIPMKCINLNKSSVHDDETLYTQTPNIPLTNINYVERFSYTIPNGVYQFFIRYKIRDGFYTDWFPASKELFASNSETASTSFGTVAYMNEHRDSDYSFKFRVEHLIPYRKDNYESFQIGFLLSHDDTVYARAWKHFNFDVAFINFDYDAKDAEEIAVIDLIKVTYQIYDVGNVTAFKNKVYISNYKETDFNDKALIDKANNVKITLKTKTSVVGYNGYPIVTTKLNGKDYVNGITVSNANLLFASANGLFDKLMNTTASNSVSAATLVSDSIGDNSNSATTGGGSLYGFECTVERLSLSGAKNNHKMSFRGTDTVKYSNFSYNNTISEVSVNGVTIENYSLATILAAIYNDKRYMDDSCIFVNKGEKPDNSFKVVITRPCTYEVTKWVNGGLVTEPSIDDSTTGGIVRPDDSNPSGEGKWVTTSVSATYEQTITISFFADSTKYTSGDVDKIFDYTTLMPYQKYKFFMHFVRSNGETTNGYYCGGSNAGVIDIPYRATADTLIYPSFSNVSIPIGYVACFFSILHVENNVGTVFNIDLANTLGEASCLDINLGLLKGNNNLTIKQGTKSHIVVPGSGGFDTDEPLQPDFKVQAADATNATVYRQVVNRTGKFYYSGDSTNSRYFGADGILTFDKTGSEIVAGKLAYVVNDYVAADSEDVELIKCTPYITSSLLVNSTFEDYTNMNLLSYICAIYPLDRERTIKYYTDGSSVFKKYTPESGGYFSLKELKNYLGDAQIEDEKITAMSLEDTSRVLIYSNYNLNHLTLTEDIKPAYKTYYLGQSSATTSESYSLVLRLFSSLTLSNVYSYPSMYKEFTRKVYGQFKKNEFIEFNNTIRSSALEGDESELSILKFKADDYYNVPTNRGQIVNLVSVGDVILAHTTDSIFKFTGSNTLQSNDGEIQTPESQPFDTGVTEVFGSDFGYAGLQNKTDHIITELGYIFFDRDSRVVYMYSGQGQIVKLSESIEKLFRHKDIASISFANDYYNNRFFMSIKFHEYKKTIDLDGVETLTEIIYPVTLSFSVVDNIKSFVSLHDFYYYKAFNTKTKCYFVTDDSKDLCSIDKTRKGCYTKLELVSDTTYPSVYNNSVITAKADDSDTVVFTKYVTKHFDSIIDVIDNSAYERIKTLNYVDWCGGNIETEYKQIKADDINSLKVAEDTMKKVPCKAMRIYNDFASTELMSFSDIANNSSISSTNSYKLPRYNQGIWTFNYFRNLQTAKTQTTKYVSDQNSLIEGKYFVVRFLYNADFKLETMNLSTSIKQ